MSNHFLGRRFALPQADLLQPFQGFGRSVSLTQGVALGWHVAALRAKSHVTIREPTACLNRS